MFARVGAVAKRGVSVSDTQREGFRIRGVAFDMSSLWWAAASSSCCLNCLSFNVIIPFIKFTHMKTPETRNNHDQHKQQLHDRNPAFTPIPTARSIASVSWAWVASDGHLRSQRKNEGEGKG